MRRLCTPNLCVSFVWLLLCLPSPGRAEEVHEDCVYEYDNCTHDTLTRTISEINTTTGTTYIHLTFIFLPEPIAYRSLVFSFLLVVLSGIFYSACISLACSWLAASQIQGTCGMHRRTASQIIIDLHSILFGMLFPTRQHVE